MLRLAGLIAFVILAVVLLVVLVRGCASDSKHARYENYINDTRKVAAKNPLGYVGIVLANGEVLSGLFSRVFALPYKLQ